MSNALKLILTVTVLIAVAVGLYFVLSNVDFFASATQRADEVQARTEEIEREILADLRKIELITLSSDIFTNPAFVSLTNLSQPLAEPRLARPDPFAPLN